MTNYENLNQMNLNELANWLDMQEDCSVKPWDEYFEAKYCSHCEAIKRKNAVLRDLYNLSEEEECSWCEINHNCKFFQDLDDVPSPVERIAHWLKASIDD